MADEALVNRTGDRPRGLGRTTDILVYGVFLGLGALEFGLSQRSEDFHTGDSTYFELARSLVEQGFYGFNFQAQTTLPPGFPALLALLCVTVGCSHAVLIRSMAVFATLGFIVSYELLRRLQGRAVAAVFCILLGSSPLLFRFATTMVFSDVPYFFTSIATLLLARQLDIAKSLRMRAALWLMCGFLLVWSVLMRSAGIALLTGLVGWLTASWFADREAAARRFKTFLPLLLTGLVVQGLWMHWAAEREALEWPLVGGYPHSYMAQLRVKDGNRPELGMASLSDIPPRVAQNLGDRAVWLTYLLTRKSINPAWFSPIVLGPVLLVLVGVGCSMWRGGGRWPEWYFVSHEAIYLLWPWREVRFFLPVAPLACLYLWRGGEALLGVASLKPRAVGALSLPLSILLGLYAGDAAWASRGVQPALDASFWASVAAASAWMVWTNQRRLPAPLGRLWSRPMVIAWGKSVTLPTVIGAVAVCVLVEAGIARQLHAGRDNLTFDVTRSSQYPDIRAGQWIGAHTATTAVVMARQVDVVYHYSRRKVVWFPPLRDPQQLMEGIRRHKVEFVIVNRRDDTYWFPPDQDCFEPLFSAYPEAFRLVHEEPRLRIFQMVEEWLRSTPSSVRSRSSSPTFTRPSESFSLL